MAGDIQEPFRLSFQGDSLHSGSISFGRFEAESLSWERRSSFSHNRYLEEVEKYSKPGSVTEKKAYFEAHFRKKALLKQSSSEWQNGREYQTNENDDPHYLEEFENGNVSRHFTCFDESPDSSGDDEESEVMECEIDAGVLYSEPQVEPVINSTNNLVTVPEHVKPEETNQTERGNLVSINTESEREETLVDEAVQVDVTSEAIDSSPSSHTAEKDDSASAGHRRIPSPKVRPASESKLTKPKLKSLANVTQVQRTISSEASKGSAKPMRRESEDLLTSKTEKKISRHAVPITRSVGKTSKSEDLGGSKEKIVHQKKSIEKELRTEKAVESQSSALEKSVPGVRQTANRPKQTTSSSKPGMNQSAEVFSFKSDQRAERRKEEKTEAEMKQFRKSLNFKATPMPSFYSGSAHGSDRNKVVSSDKKSSKLRTTSNSGVAPAGRSPSHSKVANGSDQQKASGVTNSSVPSDTYLNSPTSATNRNHPTEAGKKNDVTEKKEQDKKKDTSSQKQKESDGRKGHRVEGKHKVEAASRSDMLRKDMKGVHMGNGSKAVGVVS